ncbi:MAG: tyrosinase family protein [Roseivirga sp.]|nr:tyrosinase family protein [Roseivirga sp.]
MTNEIYSRKSIYALSGDEKTALRDAFSVLYTTPEADSQSLESKVPKRYQQLAIILNEFGHYQWNDLLFLPWARAYFWWFEQALRSVSPGISLPYWDYTSSRAIAEGLPEFFTDETYVSSDGTTKANPLLLANYKFPFSTFREVKENTDLLSKAAKLIPEVNNQTGFIDFSLSVYPVDILSHSYIGGSSANPNSASYDPVFWFTHCQLDHLWWQWQKDHHDHEVPVSVKKTQLMPFTKESDEKSVILTGEDVLNTVELGYRYES